MIAAFTALGISALDATTLATLYPTRALPYLTTLANAIVAGLPLGRTAADMGWVGEWVSGWVGEGGEEVRVVALLASTNQGYTKER